MNCLTSTNKRKRKYPNVIFFVISVVELRYKETERSRVEFNSYNKRDQQNMSVMSIDKMNSIRQNVLEDNFKNELAQLIFQNKRLNETNEKVIA